MPGSGQIIGGPSQKYSGIIDLRGFQELEARVVALEEALGVSKKIRGGLAVVEWTVMGFESAVTKVATGLAVIQAAVGGYIGSTQVLGGVTMIEGGGKINVQARQITGEVAAGVKETVGWIAIGE